MPLLVPGAGAKLIRIKADAAHARLQAAFPPVPRCQTNDRIMSPDVSRKRAPWSGFVHVMARGNQGQPLFGDDQDRRRFLEALGEAKPWGSRL